MSDFTDDEDRQLVQLARMLSQPGRKKSPQPDQQKVQQSGGQKSSTPGNQINWNELLQLMIESKKTKAALRQRLKTLKRKHGNVLAEFPAWFFKKRFASTADAVWHAVSPPVTPRRSPRPRTSRKAAVRRSILKNEPATDTKTTGDAPVTVAPTTSLDALAPRCEDQQSESPLWVLAVAAETRSSNDAPAAHEKTSMRYILSHDGV